MTTVVAGAAAVLTAEWRLYGGGPLTAVTGVQITITRVPATVVLGPTSTGVSTPATGINAYTWSTATSLTPGTYLVAWSGTDTEAQAVTATELVTVLAATGSWAPDYVDPEVLADFVRANADDPYVAVYGTAASRAVDDYCGRQFGQLAAAATLTYEAHRAAQLPSGRWLVRVDDLQDTSGLTVDVDGTALDSGDDGYHLWPRNNAVLGRPYTGVTLASRPSADLNVLGRFGWNSVPTPVMGATWLQVNRWHTRRESPYGIAGSPSEGSEVKLTAVLDPDVRAILAGGGLIRKRATQ